MRKVLFFGMSSKDRNDLFDVRRSQFIVVRDLDALVRRVDEKRIAVGFVLFQHHDAGGDGRAEKEIARKLNDAIHKVVIDQVFADLLFGSAAVHNAGEADDRSRSVGGEP